MVIGVGDEWRYKKWGCFMDQVVVFLGKKLLKANVIWLPNLIPVSALSHTIRLDLI